MMKPGRVAAFDSIQPNLRSNNDASDSPGGRADQAGQLVMKERWISLKAVVLVIFLAAVVLCSSACLRFTVNEFMTLSERMGKEHMKGAAQTLHLETDAYLTTAVSMMSSWNRLWTNRSAETNLQNPADRQWWRDMFLDNMISSYYDYSIMATCFEQSSYIDAYSMHGTEDIGGWWMPGDTDLHTDCSWSPTLSMLGCNITNSTYDCTQRPWYSKSGTPGAVNWSRLYTTTDQGLLSTMATTGMYDAQNEFIGVTGVVVALSHVSDILHKTKAHNRMYVDTFFVDEQDGTMVASTLPDPVIVEGDVVMFSEYSKFTRNLAGLASTLTPNKTVVMSLEGDDHYVMKTELESGNLKWNGFILIPVSAILSDVSFAVKIALVSAGIILFIWVAAVFITLSFVMNSLSGVTSQLIKIASLNLKQPPMSLSVFSEVKTLQISAELAKQNLGNIVPFLPEKTSSVLIETTEQQHNANHQDELGDEEMVAASIVGLEALSAGLGLKKLTVVSSSVSCDGLLITAEASKDSSNFVKQNVLWFSLLSAVSTGCKGATHSYSEDQVLTTFTQTASATRFVHSLLASVAQNPTLSSLPSSNGCATGTCYVGSLGGGNIRTHAVVGPLCSEARVLSMLCVSRRSAALLCKETAVSSREVCPSPLRAIDRIMMPNATSSVLIFDLAPTSTPGATNEEIYAAYFKLWDALDDGADAPHLRELVSCDLDAAKPYPPTTSLFARFKEKVDLGPNPLSTYTVTLSTAPTLNRTAPCGAKPRHPRRR